MTSADSDCLGNRSENIDNVNMDTGGAEPSTVCCPLSAVCCLLFAVCCPLSGVCCLLSAVCCPWLLFECHCARPLTQVSKPNREESMGST
jgi:hypothetical protein